MAEMEVEVEVEVVDVVEWKPTASRRGLRPPDP